MRAILFANATVTSLKERRWSRGEWNLVTMAWNVKRMFVLEGAR